MSANQLEQRRPFKPRPFHARDIAVDRRRRQALVHRDPHPPVADEEMKFVMRAVIWMAVLGVTPLTLFHVLNFLYPDLFWIPITPD